MWRLKREIHESWLVAALAFSICVGVILSVQSPLWLSAVTWLLLGLALAGVSFVVRRAWVISLICVSGLCIGMWRGDVVRHTMMVYQHIVGKTVMLDGSVAEDPDTDKSGSMTVRLHDVSINGHTLPGDVWVGVVGQKPIERSDRVVVKGKLLAGFASF
ncbi:MAG TPA: hypothetical protein VFQ70_00100, partial [Candidatus Saccharimonadaceae bacterium]|nr:hypothetical protein [Candidatus Saccharimonadaceae bacterium]